MQLAFALMYTVIALAVLLSAAWLGLNFANRLVAPIRRLIGAANIVSTGNLYIQVPVRRSEGDLAPARRDLQPDDHELRTQRDDIVRARDLIDSAACSPRRCWRARAPASSASTREGRISILNRSAEKLIGPAEADVIGQPLAEVVPELEALITKRAPASSGWCRGR